MPMTEPMARQMFELIEPVALVTYMADEPTAAVMALGLPSVWDAYFAGRAAPLGRDIPATVVHARARHSDLDATRAAVPASVASRSSELSGWRVRAAVRRR